MFILDNDPTLTNSLAKRGDYIYSISSHMVEKLYVKRKGRERYYSTRWVEVYGPRAPVAGWERVSSESTSQRV